MLALWRKDGMGTVTLALLSVLVTGPCAYGQTPIAADASKADASAKQAAPIDLSGYWVSLVTTDWRWRMLTPARGDYQSVPLNERAYELALKWDPAKDEAAREQCKSYGAAALMAVPGRLHISWQDEGTLRVQTDAGMQTRLLHFAPWSASADVAASWQGQSMAKWELHSPVIDPLGAGGANDEEMRGLLALSARTAQPPAGRWGSLKVVTTNLLPGYLRKNGIPYSDQTRVTEYWDLVSQHDGTPLLVITSIVHDPVYLQQEWITALHFEKEPDGSKWNPQPCSARW